MARAVLSYDVVDALSRSATGAFAMFCHVSCGSSSSGPPTTTAVDGGSPADGATSIPMWLDIPTDKGTVHGSTSGGVRSFLGIPFAASTEGANRWRAPQPAVAWNGTRDATALGPICPQVKSWPPDNPRSEAGAEVESDAGSENLVANYAYDPASSEDCLSVNVWTPDPAPTTPVPVMVWIYGGAFIFGSGGYDFGSGSGAPLYSGQHLVPQGIVVVVTFNYRVGQLGFLAHSALSAENSAGASGNYGIRDQRAALQWVQTNIAAFGGDKNNVTLFGESAGGWSVCLHLVSPASQGLFHRAIVESGICVAPLSTLSTAEAKGDRLAELLGCTDSSTTLSCLRGLTADAVTTVPANVSYQPGRLLFQDSSTTFIPAPIVDGQVVTGQPATLLANKQMAPVPVLGGANTSEGTLFNMPGAFLDTPVVSDSDYQTALARTFDGASAAIATQYPSRAFASPNDALTQVTADAFFVCPARRTAQLLAGAGDNTYLYSFNGTLSGTPFEQLAGIAFHSAELPYVFGTSDELGSVSAGDRPLSDAIQRYWLRFAKTGDPNGGSDPMWPAYTQASDQHLSLDRTISVGSGLEKANCDFWDTLGL
jgi:para-nitrobenzyl esterase